MTAAYDFVQHLADLDVPIFTAAPGTPGAGEFTDRPRDWSKLTAEHNAQRIGAWSPGEALMGLMGGTVAVVDVDPRNGGDVEAIRVALAGLNVRIFGEVLTPGGGWHFYVAGHPALATAHKLTGFPGIDVQSFGAVAYLPGTSRPKYDGAGYVVMVDNLEALADGGDPDGAEALAGWVAEHRSSSAETFTPSEPWSGDPPDARQAAYLAAVLRNQHDKIAAMRSDSGRNTAVYEAGLVCGNYVAGAGMDGAEVERVLFEAATACQLVRDDGADSVRASIWSGLRNGKCRPRAVPQGTTMKTSSIGPMKTSSIEERRAALAQMLDGLRSWQHLPDPAHVVVVLAVAATRNHDGEPVWLLTVAPPSSGKTEAVRVLDEVADARLDEVTAAGLLGWSKGKTVKPSGVLARAPEQALATFGDLSTLLATSDRGGRDQVFGLLRRAYDGHVTRDVSPPGKVTEGHPETLRWSGRLTVVAAVTGAIDRYTAHADALGARWVYVRLPQRDTEEKRRASALARRGDLAQHRQSAREQAAAILRSVPDRDLPALPEDVADDIEDAALVTAWGRGAVPRNGYGRRDIEGVPVVEEPMRLVQQLGALARGVLALGLPEEAAAALARRVALDSMPEARRAVLAALATGEELTTSGVARAASLDRKVARFQLEELAAIGVVEHDRPDDENEDMAGVVHWRLSGDDGALIAAVFSAHVRFGGWDETWVYTSTSPQEREEEETPTGGNPTFRPTPFGLLLAAKPAPPDPSPQPCASCGEANPDHRARLYCRACWPAPTTKETANAS